MSDHNELETQKEQAKKPFGNKFVLPLILLLGLFSIFYFINKGNGGHGDHHAEQHQNGHHDDDGHHNDDDHHDHEHEHDHDHGHHDDHAHEDADASSEEDETEGDLAFESGSWAWSIQNYLSKGEGSPNYNLDKIPYDGEELSAEGEEQLDNLAKLLMAYPDINVLVKGHSRLGDNAVEKTTNKATSKARALWVQAKLSNRGVSGKQMKAKGIGGDELLADIDPKDMAQRRISIEFEK
ncbi:MAG: OmpA family protein [Bacteroidota bacterium]